MAIPNIKLIQVELCQRSLRDFLRIAWPIVEPETILLPNWHIDAISDHLQALFEGEIRSLIINIPPRFMKSLTCCVFFPVWSWLKSPAFRWITSSYQGRLAVRDSVKSRRIIQSSFYQEILSLCQEQPFVLQGDQNVKSYYENDKGGHRYAVGAEAGSIGFGADCIVCDDPHNVKQAESDDVRENRLEWWDKEMSTRLDNPKTGRKLVIQQRLHDNDLTGHLLEQGGYELLKLPQRFNPEKRCITSLGFEDPRKEPGDLLHPQRFGEVEAIDLLKRQGSITWAAMQQQEPFPPSGNLFNPAWFRLWEVLPSSFDKSIISLDAAFKDLVTSSFVVLQAWGFSKGNAFLIDEVRGHFDIVETIKRTILFIEKHPTFSERLIEDKANGTAVIRLLKDRIPGIIPVSPTESKDSRATAIAPFCESGNVWIPKNATWKNDWLLEVQRFPQKPNDRVDTMVQALSRVFLGVNSFGLTLLRFDIDVGKGKNDFAI